jgi:DNA-binding transcriptional LysR family regulator
VIDFRDLEFFVAAYEARSFAQAAARLSTVQSNVSLRVRNLEALLDAPLFERHRRGIEPTEKGKVLYGHARAVLAQIARIPAALDESKAA